MYVTGTVYLGFTAIFEPIADELGWSYTQISLAASLRGLEVGLLVPVAGLIMDRWGPKKLIFGGTFICGLGMLLLSEVHSLLVFYTAFIIISIGVSSTPTSLLMAAVSHWFRKNVGLAMGITSAGVSIGGLLLPLITIIIDSFGWRKAVLFMGLGMWAIPLPLSLFLRHKPEQYGYLPDGETHGSVEQKDQYSENKEQTFDATTKEALLSLVFWMIGIAYFCHVMATSAVITHIMPYLSSLNIERSTSSLIASTLPLIGITGRVGFGWLGDRVDKRNIGTLSLAMSGLGVFVLGYTTDERTWIIAAFIALFGIGWGGVVPMLSGLLIKYFGRKNLATIVGCIASIMMAGMVVGSPFAGWIFDKWGSYQPAWFILGGILMTETVVFYFYLRFHPERGSLQKPETY
ncbi:MFS transporter [Thermodesulfobacteriota bacterium]